MWMNATGAGANDGDGGDCKKQFNLTLSLWENTAVAEAVADDNGEKTRRRDMEMATRRRRRSSGRPQKNID